MRHHGISASEMGQLADAFDKKTFDLKITFPIGIAIREIAVILNDTAIF